MAYEGSGSLISGLRIGGHRKRPTGIRASSGRFPSRSCGSSAMETRAWPFLRSWRRLIGYTRRDDATLLATREHRGPLRVQKALYPEGAAVCHAIVLHPPGGIAGGDRLDVRHRRRARAPALLTTPGAGKWYRSRRSPATQQRRASTSLKARSSNGCRRRRSSSTAPTRGSPIDIRLAAARCIGWDILCLGRTRRGERFDARQRSRLVTRTAAAHDRCRGTSAAASTARRRCSLRRSASPACRSAGRCWRPAPRIDRRRWQRLRGASRALHDDVGAPRTRDRAAAGSLIGRDRGRARSRLRRNCSECAGRWAAAARPCSTTAHEPSAAHLDDRMRTATRWNCI